MIYRAEKNSQNQIVANPYGGMPENTPTPDAICATAASNATKKANAPGYILRTGNRFTMRVLYSNSSKAILTLNVNETGAKVLCINGQVSSSTNYTIPAGDYEVVYDGTAYYICTDTSIPGTVAVNNGGTGATTALAARQNLATAGTDNLAPTEATRTMSSQRTAGSYVYIKADDQFYQVTTTIAASGTLVPGTNATAKSIGEVLSTLNSDLTALATSLTTLPYLDNTSLFTGLANIFGTIHDDKNGVILTISCTETPDATKAYAVIFLSLSGTARKILLASELATNNLYMRWVQYSNNSVASVTNWAKIFG